MITKDEYLLRNFSKIKHKKWELFVITRILHLLDDPDLEYVCQQFIRVKNNNSFKLLKFEKTLEELDLVNFYSIKNFNNDYVFYEIIFNGTSINFINTMKSYKYFFDTQKKIWILK